jgi:hypothetical protein
MLLYWSVMASNIKKSREKFPVSKLTKLINKYINLDTIYIIIMAGIGRFVAVGDSLDDASNIGYSTNGGQTWQVADNTDGLFFDGADGRGKGIAYGLKQDGSGVFVAVGDSLDDASSIGYSLDGGLNWQVAANPDGLFFNGSSSSGVGSAVAYGLKQDGSGVFVAVGNSENDASNIGYSLNGGQTWQVADNTDGLFRGDRGYAVAYGLNQDGSGVFVAVGGSSDDASNIGYSPNGGLNWQVATATDGLFTGGYGGYAVAYGYNLNGTGVFVAVGGSTDNEKQIGYSTDGGQTWQAADNPNGLFFGAYGYGVAYGLNQDGRGVFVAVGFTDNDSNTIGFSTNGGKSWQAASNTDGLFQGLGGYGVAFGYTSDGSGVFVAVGNSSINDLSNIGYSFDGGDTWKVASAIDGLFIGDKGRAITFSRDLPLSPPPPLPPLPTLSNVFVTLGLSTGDISNIGYSLDGGQNWLVANQYELLGLNFGGYGVAYGKNLDGSGVFVALVDGASNATNMGYSLDSGQTWLLASETNGLFGGRYGYGVAYGLNQDGSGVFVAVGNSSNDLSNIGYSSDGGLTWSVVSPADHNGLFKGSTGFGVAYGYTSDGSGVFVAVGDSTNDLSNIGYSQDGGQTWTVVSRVDSDGLFKSGYGGAVAYGYTSDGNGVFVAVGDSFNDLSNIGYSSDGGQTWQVASETNGLFFGGYGDAVAYGYTRDGSGVFVAVGDSADDLTSIGFSTDGGQTWQVASETDGLFQGGQGFGVTFGYTSDGSGVFVAVGNSTDNLSNIGYSFDGGDTWRVASPENLDGLFFGGYGNAIAFSIELPLSPPTPPTPPTPPISNICFPVGTLIKTDQGIFPIENLQSSKKTINKHSINKHTIDQYTINKQPIQHITKTMTQDPYLICFEQHALGPNIPSEKTVMTKDHKLMFEGRYVAAEKFLTRSNKVKKVKYNGEILYNVLLENYGTLQVNNLVCETLHPDNIIAKLYNNYSEAERPDLVCQLNASLLERNATKYKAVERKIFKK